MKQLIISPDPLILARKWLSLHIDAPVFGERPARLPSGPFVILRESGGGRKRALVITPFYFAVEAWHDTTEDASELARRVAALFDAWAGTTTFGPPAPIDPDEPSLTWNDVTGKWEESAMPWAVEPPRSIEAVVYTSASTSPVYNPDAETRRARYTFAADGTLRATVEPIHTTTDKE